MIQSFGRKALLTALAASTLTISGCATETRYRPATGHGFERTGYSDRRIEPNHFLISFAGNSDTSRDTVERYLFFRAAELTLQNGFDNFTLVTRDTETRTTTTVDRSWGAGPWGGWRPYWRWYRPRFGWRAWDPWFDDPFMNDFDVRTINQYEAAAEIIVGRGPKPDNVRAFNAREVVERLGPTIEYPKTRR
jgi:hypothetical protein